MSIPLRSATINAAHNRENRTKPGKADTSVPLSRPAQRPILRDIKPLNRCVPSQSSLLSKKPSLPSDLPKRSSILPAPLASKPTTRLASITNVTNKPATTTNHADLKAVEKIVSRSTNQIETIVDVDTDDQKNPFLVTDYIQDIFRYLRELEYLHKIEEKYLSDHHTTARMRSVLVNWMIDVCINFKFLQETLYLSISILDRYLQVNKTVGRDSLQLIGVAAMVVASKYEEIYMPAISDFVYIADNSFSSKEIFKAERDILGKLNFNLSRPLSVHFLRRFSKIVCCNVDQHNLAKYFLEVFLLDYNLCSINPSLQAASACCLSLCVFKDMSNPAKAWSKTLEYYSTYKYSDLEPVILKLVLAFRKMEKSKFQAIKKKYADKKLGNISNHLKLQTSKALRDIYERASLTLAEH